MKLKLSDVAFAGVGTAGVVAIVVLVLANIVLTLGVPTLIALALLHYLGAC